MVRSKDKLARALCAAAGLAAALYVIPGCSSNRVDLKALAKGDMAKLVVDDAPAPAPDTPFVDAAGKPHTLAEFKGKVVVLNLWATWCGPCVQEMPTLAKLQAGGDPKIVVVPVSLDRAEDLANAEAFIAKRAPLTFYSEPKYALAYALKPPVAGLPTTVLIDVSGKVRAQLGGGADWSGPDAHKVLEALESPS